MKKPPIVARHALPPFKLCEADISPVVLAYARTFPNDPRVVRELGLVRHTSRIDVGIIQTDKLIGIEIKSAKDYLGARWERQRDDWTPIFDELHIVITQKHLSKALDTDSFCPKVPPFWGVLLAEREGDDVTLRQFRAPMQNTKQDRRTLFGCLWKAEAVALVREKLGWTSSVTRGPIHTWYPRAANELSLVDIREAVVTAFRTRGHLKERDGRIYA